jgi:putative hydrolase of the HAD superfamily
MREIRPGSGQVRPLTAYRWLSFDVVGTLIDFERGILDFVEEIARITGTDLRPEQVLECFGRAEGEQQRLTPGLPFTQMLEPIYQRVAGELGLPTAEEYGVALRESIRTWPAFPDAAEALAELGRRYRLVALTNADNWALKQMAATLGNPFDDAVTAEDVGVNKPDPRVFLHCADRQRSHGYAPEDWLHVAQSQYHDIAAASRLGVATCWIERRAGQDGFGATPTPEEVTKPDYRFTSLHELAAAVAS